jgi:hypothetical protein
MDQASASEENTGSPGTDRHDDQKFDKREALLFSRTFALAQA